MVIKLEQAFANELQLVIRIFYLEESLWNKAFSS
jgi:hypothetical protein